MQQKITRSDIEKTANPFSSSCHQLHGRLFLLDFAKELPSITLSCIPGSICRTTRACSVLYLSCCLLHFMLIFLHSLAYESHPSQTVFNNNCVTLLSNTAIEMPSFQQRQRSLCDRGDLTAIQQCAKETRQTA